MRSHNTVLATLALAGVAGCSDGVGTCEEEPGSCGILQAPLPGGQPTLPPCSNSNEDEHCSIGADTANLYGIIGGIGGGVCRQIKIILNDGSESRALCTVTEIVAGDTQTVRINSTALDAKFPGTAYGTQVRIMTMISFPGAAVVAQATNDALETLEDTPGASGLAVTAPHGGNIEPGTSEQASMVKSAFVAPKTTVPVLWKFEGWSGGGLPLGTTHARWHTTSTEINTDSFVQLGSIISRGFMHAVSFHGYTGDKVGGFEKKEIQVGGDAPPSVRTAVRDAIIAKLVAAGVTAGKLSDTPSIDGTNGVRVDLAWSSDKSGTEATNFVNRLSTNGVQLEQTKIVRDSYGDTVAQGVADYYKSVLP